MLICAVQAAFGLQSSVNKQTLEMLAEKGLTLSLWMAYWDFKAYHLNFCSKALI